MWWYLLILFPALVAIVWSVVVKVRVKAWRDMVDMLVCAVAAVVNVLFVCFAFQHDSLPTCGLLIRQLVSVIILPVAYSFFARQLSTQASPPAERPSDDCQTALRAERQKIAHFVRCQTDIVSEMVSSAKIP